MAGLLYIYCIAYSFGWGPVPWIVVSEIFNNRTRAHGVSFASATQWLFNFSLSQATPRMVTALGWKLFIFFASINVAMVVFSYLLPETKGKTLEEMDVLFGTIDASDKRQMVEHEERVIENQLAAGGQGNDILYDAAADGSSSKDGDDKERHAIATMTRDASAP